MLFSSLFFGPFALMVCIYVHIFCIVKKHQATRLRFRRAGSSFRPRASEALRSTSRQMAKNVKAVHTTLFILGKTEKVDLKDTKATKFLMYTYTIYTEDIFLAHVISNMQFFNFLSISSSFIFAFNNPVTQSLNASTRNF